MDFKTFLSEIFYRGHAELVIKYVEEACVRAHTKTDSHIFHMAHRVLSFTMQIWQISSHIDKLSPFGHGFNHFRHFD